MGLKGSDPGLGFGRSSQLKTQHPLSARSRYLMAPWRNNFLKSFLSPLLGLYFHSVDLASVAPGNNHHSEPSRPIPTGKASSLSLPVLLATCSPSPPVGSFLSSPYSNMTSEGP